MSSFEENLNQVSIEHFSLEDPAFEVKLSVLARLQSDAEYYADEARQYKVIRNKLVTELQKVREELRISRAETAYLSNVIKDDVKFKAISEELLDLKFSYGWLQEASNEKIKELAVANEMIESLIKSSKVEVE